MTVCFHVPVAQRAESDLSPLHWDAFLKRFSAVSDEGDKIDAGKDGEKSLLDAHQQVIDLCGGRFRLPVADLVDGEGLTFAVGTEENGVAAVALLQGGHRCPSVKGNATPMARSPVYQNRTRGN